MATLDHYDKTFTSALIREALPKLPYFNPQNLANTIWALATLDHYDKTFTSALIREALPKLPYFNPQNLANTIWALAKLGHHDTAFTSALIQEVRPRLPDFTPQGLANTIWALATLGHYDKAFIAVLIIEAKPRLPNFNSQDLANTMWALTALVHYDEAFTASLVHEAAADRCDLITEGQRQMFQSLLILKARGLLTLDNLLESSHPQLWKKCCHAWLDSVRVPRSSMTQLRVLALVKELPGCHGAVSEHLTEDGMLSIDIAVLLPAHGAKLAVEVDGPQHFMRDGSLTTNTKMRNLLLEARGWTVVSVPVDEWDRLEQRGRGACLEYLEQALFGRLETVRSRASI